MQLKARITRNNVERKTMQVTRSERSLGDTRSPAFGKIQVTSRVAASLLGGYGFVWGFAALGTVAGVAAGMPYAEAQTLMYLLAFLVFVTVFCWAFTERSLVRIWTVLGGGGVVMTVLAWLASRAQL